jgi:hypothetical protein
MSIKIADGQFARPTYIIDEHNEAFLVWSSIFNNIAPIKRHLIHIDEHADFGIPFLTKPVPDQFSTEEQLVDFTYRQLTIGTFLIPSAIRKFFSTLTWIKPSFPISSTLENIYINYNPELYKISILDNPINNCTQLKYISSIWQDKIFNSDKWMLDICLDAFNPNKFLTPDPFTLEITKIEFERLNYHDINVWNMRYGASVTTAIKDNRFYFNIDFSKWSSPENIALDNNINNNLKNFEKFINSTSTLPDVITICRSIRSGHTRRDEVESIQDFVLKTLKSKFN